MADLAGTCMPGDLKGLDKLPPFLQDALGKGATAMGVQTQLTGREISDRVAGVRWAGKRKPAGAGW